MPLLALGGSAVVPSLLLLWYIHSRDRYPEPFGLLFRTFLWGAVICLPVVPVANALESAGTTLEMGMWSGAGVKAFLGAALPEEFFKFLVLVLYVWRKPDFDEPMDGVVYGATASLGFATLENILYVGQYGMDTAVMRALTAVPGHAFTGVVMGAYVGRARFSEPGARAVLLVQGLFWAILLHGLYDAFLMTESGYAVFSLGVLGIEISWGRRLIRALRADQDAQSAPFIRPVRLLSDLSTDVPTFARTAAASPLAEPPHRTAWGWMKLWSGALGLTFCGLWWLIVYALLADAAPDHLEAVGKAALVVASLVPTFLFFKLFRSGVQVESAPLRAAVPGGAAPMGR